MLRRCYRVYEAKLRHRVQQALELCRVIDEESLPPLTEPVLAALRVLQHDRRVLFCGGAGSGKSSLLAAVAECPVMAKRPLETAYVCWRYRCDDGDATASCFLPEESLEGLELVDTGDCALPEVADTVAALMPGADVVVAVMDARRVEESPAWALLARPEAQQAGTLMLALTHTDALAAEELLQLKSTVRELCRTRMSKMPVAYDVSPTVPAVVEAFTSRVQDALAAPGGLRDALQALREQAINLVYKASDVLRGRALIMQKDSGFLAGVEQEIENFLAHQRRGVQGCCEHYTEAVQRVAPRLCRALRRAYGWFYSPVLLVRLEHFGEAAERCYTGLLQQEIGRHQQENDRSFVLSCAGHWKSVRPRMKQALGCEIGEFPESALSAELELLRRRLENALARPFQELKWRARMGELFRASLPWRRMVLVLLCLLLLLAGVTGFLGQDSLALVVLSVVGGLWLLATLLHYRDVYAACRCVRGDSEELREAMAPLLAEEVEALVLSRVAAYRRLFAEPRQRVADYEASLTPLQSKCRQLLDQLRDPVPHT